MNRYVVCIQQLVGCKNCDRSIFDFIVTFELFYMLLLELTNKWPLLREYQLSCYLHLNSEYISSLIILVVIHSMYSCNYYTDSLKIMNFNKICYRHWWSQRKSMCQYVECRWLLQLKKNNILSPPVGNQLLNCLVIDTIINIPTPGKTNIAGCDQGIIDPTGTETWKKLSCMSVIAIF